MTIVKPSTFIFIIHYTIVFFFSFNMIYNLARPTVPHILSENNNSKEFIDFFFTWKKIICTEQLYVNAVISLASKSTVTVSFCFVLFLP